MLSKLLSHGTTLALLALLINQTAIAHCQIPCGIYDDHARVATMLEDVETIHKSIVQINELSGKSDPQSRNQLVRWVMNKEQHAQAIIDSVSDYFLTQRVKSSQDDYVRRLADHHAVIVNAMKAKQTVDMDIADTLRVSVERLEVYYPKHEH